MMSPNGDRIADGLRVLEVGSSASVAVACMALADQGAEVILCEPPGGSPLRGQPAFRMWGRGKQSAITDLSRPEGRSRFGALARQADVVVMGLKPASVDRLGVGYAEIGAPNPRLVYCALTGFGSRGPYRDVPVYDGVIAARGGRMRDFSTLFDGTRPAYAAAPVAAHAAGMLLLQGVFSALRERSRTGLGQCVETSMAQALTIYDLMSWPPGASVQLRLEDLPFLPYSVARTADGIWLQFSQNGPALFADFLRVLGLEGVIEYANSMGGGDPDELRAVRTRILEKVSLHTWSEWQKRFEGERNLAVEPFWEPGEALAHPQLLHVGDSIEVRDPEIGPTRQLGPLVDVPSLPGRVSGPAPPLGASDAFHGRTRPSTASGSEAPGKGLLHGVTVLEFAMWIATPFAATLLAELGARVIKVETLDGDPMRRTGPIAYKLTQGKESIALDLKRPEGREIAHRLAARADALVHSYRPGAPERLGIDFATLHEINPRLVYVYNGSYGSTGPKAYSAAFHVTGGALCGGARAQAGAALPPPPEAELTTEEVAAVARHLERCNEANPDFNSAVAAAVALTMGLYAREQTGSGLSLETRMMLSNAYMMSSEFIDWPGRPARRLPDADVLGMDPLYRLYPTREGWIFLAAPSQRDFERSCLALGIDELARDPRFADAAARERHAEALATRLAEAFSERDADAWERDLTARGIACVRADQGPYSRWLFEQPWARETGLVTEVESSFGRYTRYGPALTSARPAAVGGACGSGEHTRPILAELGYEESAVSALFEAGIVAEPR